MNMFGKLEHGKFIDENNNFETFGNGLLLLFRVLSGDGWSDIMMDTLDCDHVEGFSAACGRERRKIPMELPKTLMP